MIGKETQIMRYNWEWERIKQQQKREKKRYRLLNNDSNRDSARKEKIE